MYYVDERRALRRVIVRLRNCVNLGLLRGIANRRAEREPRSEAGDRRHRQAARRGILVEEVGQKPIQLGVMTAQSLRVLEEALDGHREQLSLVFQPIGIEHRVAFHQPIALDGQLLVPLPLHRRRQQHRHSRRAPLLAEEIENVRKLVQPNVRLRELWPLALVRKPWVVSHHSWYPRTDGSVALADLVKRALSRRADVSIAVSRALAVELGPETIVIPNPYRDEIFFPRPEIPKDRALVFVGRLVSDKGLDVLIEAMGLLAARQQRPHLTVIGHGPERPGIEALVERIGLRDRVRFVGQLEGESLARELAQIGRAHV